jgi:hypothetical protein
MNEDSDSIERVVEQFLDSADAAYAEYEEGYADADATLRRLEADIEELRDALGD